jgi:hypothetical protein
MKLSAPPFNELGVPAGKLDMIPANAHAGMQAARSPVE